MKHLFINDVPLIDVRANVEFGRGAFPKAKNIPILNDEERRLVGISYKEDGPEAAQALGYQLVSGDLRENRINQWLKFIEENPEAHLYCFRGGQRSQIAVQWLSEAGVDIPRIAGGYKTLRRILLDEFNALPDLMVVSGKTGVGKTILLSKIKNSLDLERRANHRGSAFGRHIESQPAQIDFENLVAIDLMKFKDRNTSEALFIEDESRLIGRLQLPVPLQEKMKISPIVLLEDTLENRVIQIFDEYITLQWTEYEKKFGENAHDEFSCYLCTAIDAIRKRLGSAGHTTIRQLLDQALQKQKHSDFEFHQQWIKHLLEEYYDPMYSYQIDKKKERIVFKGQLAEIIEWTSATRGSAHG